MRRPTLWRCGDCDHRLPEGELLHVTVPHPKDKERVIHLNQCPECGECQNFVNVCDEPGCLKDVSCGWPSPEGYRNTCGEHWKRS